MKIFNKTRDLVLSEDARLVSSFLGRLRGLILERPKDIVLVAAREGVVESSIHMLFMGYPIDVLWLDSDKRVVEIRRGVPPFNPFKPSTWRTYKPGKPAKYVVELGVGSAEGTEVGDEIEF